MEKPRVWFVTGTSQGIGRSIIEHVLQRGDFAVATLLEPSALSALVDQHPSSHLLVLKCDVTDYAEVKEAFARAVTVFKRIDVVVNNAAYSFVCEAEGTPEGHARKMFDINFWGAANISREAIQIFREINPMSPDGKRSGGKLFNVTSVDGMVGQPCLTYYSASKHGHRTAALEGFTEGLQKEIDPRWNISITILELGAFRTEGAKALEYLPAHPAYADESIPAHKIRALLAAYTSMMPGNPDRAAARFYELAGLEKPPLRLAFGTGVELIIQKLDKAKEEIQHYENWSEGVNYDL